jgi:hypothetical protein
MNYLIGKKGHSGLVDDNVIKQDCRISHGNHALYDLSL